ncbi:MAG: hypothetical protein ACO1QB_14915, partial [Verrucomicrobiales bacterium]
KMELKPESVYSLQRSANLREWQTILSPMTSETGTFTWESSEHDLPSQAEASFFRIVEQSITR